MRFETFNPQLQTRMKWPASFVVARAYLDQLARNDGLSSARRTTVARDLDRAERMSGAQRRTALTRLAAQLDGDARTASDATRVRALAAAVRALANPRG